MRKQLLAGIVGLAAVVAGCGDDSTSGAPATTSGATAPVTTSPVTSPASTVAQTTTPDGTAPDSTTPDATVPTSTVPTSTDPAGDGIRIVSLSPTATEMMFAIGADDLLVAIDSLSNYPDAALELPHELSAYEPNVEAIAGYEPDVVLIQGDYTGLGDQLAPLGIEIWTGPAVTTMEEIYAQIEELGDLTGHEDGASEVVAGMESDIDEIVASLPAPPDGEPLTYFHELDAELYTATSDTFIGAVYSLLGLENIADAADDGSSYPQLNAEYVIEADPDLVFLADTKSGESIDTVAERPGWDVITAVRDGAVIEMDDDIASRWGPRLVEYLRAVADAVSAHVAAA